LLGTGIDHRVGPAAQGVRLEGLDLARGEGRVGDQVDVERVRELTEKPFGVNFIGWTLARDSSPLDAVL
jgi:hypothetical protein